MIIGLMGRAGSGKTYVQNEIANLFDDILDLDHLGHQLLLKEPVKSALQGKFGAKIMNNGEVSREQLRKIVFSSPKQLKVLNNEVHPFMKIEAQKWAQKTVSGLIVGALIYQIKLEKLCNIIITIDATTEEIIMKQPNYDDILQYQESREWYNSHANIIFRNTWDQLFACDCRKKIKKIIT